MAALVGSGPSAPVRETLESRACILPHLRVEFLILGFFREFCEYPQEWGRTEWKERKDLEAEAGTGPEVGTETAEGTETEMKGEGKRNIHILFGKNE